MAVSEASEAALSPCPTVSKPIRLALVSRGHDGLRGVATVLAGLRA